jgi:hypothetical protein
LGGRSGLDVFEFRGEDKFGLVPGDRLDRLSAPNRSAPRWAKDERAITDNDTKVILRMTNLEELGGTARKTPPLKIVIVSPAAANCTQPWRNFGNARCSNLG